MTALPKLADYESLPGFQWCEDEVPYVSPADALSEAIERHLSNEELMRTFDHNVDWEDPACREAFARAEDAFEDSEAQLVIKLEDALPGVDVVRLQEALARCSMRRVG